MSIVIHKRMMPFLVDVMQWDNRNISAVFRTNVGLLVITGTHAPHADASIEAKNNYYKNKKCVLNYRSTIAFHNRHLKS